MSDVERLVRESLAGRVTGAPPSEDLLPRLRLAAARQQRRRRAGVLAAACCAMVVMVAVPLGVAVSRAGSGDQPVLPGGGSPSAASASPTSPQPTVILSVQSGPLKPQSFPYTMITARDVPDSVRTVLVDGQAHLLCRMSPDGDLVSVSIAADQPSNWLQPAAGNGPQQVKMSSYQATWLPELAGGPGRWALYWQDHRKRWIVMSGTGSIAEPLVLKYATQLIDGSVPVQLPIQMSTVPANLKLAYADQSTVAFRAGAPADGNLTAEQLGRLADPAGAARLDGQLVLTLIRPAAADTRRSLVSPPETLTQSRAAPTADPTMATPSPVGTGPATVLPNSAGRIVAQADAAGTVYTVLTFDGATVAVRVPDNLVIQADDLLRFLLGLRLSPR